MSSRLSVVYIWTIRNIRGPNMPLFKGKVLVTGATGIIGTAIALEIVKAGFAVRGTSRSQKRADAWSKKYPDAHVEWFIIEDQKTLGVYDEAVRGCDAICHVAGPFTFDHKVRDSSRPVRVEKFYGDCRHPRKSWMRSATAPSASSKQRSKSPRSNASSIRRR